MQEMILRRDVSWDDSEKHAGIGRRAQSAWSLCVQETATSEGLATSVWFCLVFLTTLPCLNCWLWLTDYQCCSKNCIFNNCI